MTRAEKIKWLKRIEAGKSTPSDVLDIEKLHKDFLTTVSTEILKKVIETNDLTEISKQYEVYIKQYTSNANNRNKY